MFLAPPLSSEVWSMTCAFGASRRWDRETVSWEGRLRRFLNSQQEFQILSACSFKMLSNFGLITLNFIAFHFSCIKEIHVLNYNARRAGTDVSWALMIIHPRGSPYQRKWDECRQESTCLRPHTLLFSLLSQYSDKWLLIKAIISDDFISWLLFTAESSVIAYLFLKLLALKMALGLGRWLRQ